MHHSQFRHMALSVAQYMPADGHLRVLDVGSRNANNTLRTHRELLGDRDVEYIGVDLTDGPNVDVVMPEPYRFPVRSRSIDFVLSGSVFEHVPFPWASVLEIARVLKPAGYAFISAPSRGHVHNRYDCWRYYPDAYRALAAWSRLSIVEVFTDLPPVVPGTYHHDYSAIDTKCSYWGDSVAVLRKPRTGYPERRVALLRAVVCRVANRTKELPAVRQRPAEDAARRAVHSW